MEITQVRVFPVREDKLKAFVSVIFDSCFVVSDIKIIEGANGLFVSMPSKKCKNGKGYWTKGTNAHVPGEHKTGEQLRAERERSGGNSTATVAVDDTPAPTAASSSCRVLLLLLIPVFALKFRLRGRNCLPMLLLGSVNLSSLKFLMISRMLTLEVMLCG